MEPSGVFVQSIDLTSLPSAPPPTSQSSGRVSFETPSHSGLTVVIRLPAPSFRAKRSFLRQELSALKRTSRLSIKVPPESAGSSHMEKVIPETVDARAERMGCARSAQIHS